MRLVSRKHLCLNLPVDLSRLFDGHQRPALRNQRGRWMTLAVGSRSHDE